MTKIWKLSPPSPLAADIAHKADISTLEAQLLINRGFSDIDSINSFLSSQLSDLMDPMLLKDMDIALELIIRSIKNNEHITVFGDYDADGITGTAILMNFFSELQIKVSPYIPERLKEGYSLNPEAVKNISQNGSKLIITIDCGISSQKEIELAQNLGISVIVTDHHQIPAEFNPTCPVINPHRPDSSFPFQNLAGVGVAFFLIVGLRAALREQGFFNNNEPDLKSYLDLAALGTVADMVPLKDQNRIIVKSGLKIMGTTKWPGIESLRESAGIRRQITSSSDIAFRLAPRLNAPGRLGDSLSGLQALTATSKSKAREMAQHLNNMNNRRQEIEGEIVKQIEESIIPNKKIKGKRVLVFYKEGWHKGVLGIVASRLLNKYHRPVIVLTIEDKIAVGSGRSIDGFDLFKALSKLEHLLVKFGGHYHAAGLTLEMKNIDALIEGIENIAKDELTDKDLVPSIEVDSEIDLKDMTLAQIKKIRSLEPFGAGNPEPVFYAKHKEVTFSKVVGERHLKLRIRQGDNSLEAIAFNHGDRYPLDGENIDFLFTPEINSWNGHDKVQLRIIDMVLSEKVQSQTD